ncbi:MFS general substrate transporter [Exidia glandulosa HHB12029]|uniref:MFS general substrate transporter n=1 Tax=Exidia glandulosa HHB12029 TaxID=1314781 RepID=A0A165N0C5_EXIGL|nr:MFS general substrate transporter [Exidia glandulosa HHB12029]
MAATPLPTSTHIAEKEKNSERASTDEDIENRLHAPTYRADVDTSGIDERKLLRKLDMRLIPWLSILYLLSFLDRTSIGNAKLYHLEDDLHITDPQYLVSLSVFFITYALFEVPSNVFLKRLRPSLWLSLLMFLWGVIMMCQGLISNYGGLISMRLLLGLFEAGLFPGCVDFYKREEFGIRAALFFSAATVSGAFGGLLAAAISNMHGVGGKPAWAWIFILEGLATILAGIASFWLVQDFPDTAKFLTETERVFVIRRLQEDDQFSAAGEKLSMKYIWAAVFDLKTWIGMLCYAGSDGPLYAFSLFLPSIINSYTATPANLLSVPVYAWACIVTCCVGFLADRIKRRGMFNLIFLGIGYAILIGSRNAKLSYFAVYLAARHVGIYPLIPNTIAWVSNNVEGSYKRSVTLGMVIGFGNLNGVVSSNIYRSIDKPWYRLGHSVVFGYICMGIITTAIMMVYLNRENTKRARGERDENIAGIGSGVGGKYGSVEEAKRVKGDKWSGYLYTL